MGESDASIWHRDLSLLTCLLMPPPSQSVAHFGQTLEDSPGAKLAPWAVRYSSRVSCKEEMGWQVELPRDAVCHALPKRRGFVKQLLAPLCSLEVLAPTFGKSKQPPADPEPRDSCRPGFSAAVTALPQLWVLPTSDSCLQALSSL